MRGGFTLPNDPEALIYPERRGTNHWAAQVKIKWLDDAPEKHCISKQRKIRKA